MTDAPAVTADTRTPFLRRRWPVVLLALALAAAIALLPLVGGDDDGSDTELGRRLQAVPVYVAPGATEGVVDVERVRAAIGDRPIVVAVLPPRRDKLPACRGLAAQLPTDLVVAYVGDGFPALCAGARFPQPDDPSLQGSVLGSATDVWLLRLSRVAQGASMFRLTPKDVDRTPEVEELVLSFDVAVSEDYDDGIPRRVSAAAPADDDALGDALPLLGVLAASFLVAGLAGQQLVIVLHDRVAGRRRLRERRLALDGELATLSWFVLRPRDAAGRESVAELYLAAMTAFEGARTAVQLDVAEAAFQRAATAARRGAEV